jgi:hypothetical protein
MRTRRVGMGTVGVGLLLVGALGVGCGPSPEPVSPDGSPVGPGAVVPVAGGEGSYDLSPVEEPKAIVGLVRFRSPAETIQTAVSAAGLPEAMAEAGATGFVQAMVKEALDRQVNAKQFANVIAMDAPVDGVVALDPDPKKKDAQAAVAIGLTSLEAAKSAAEAKAPLLELGAGMWKIGGKERHEPACAIAVSSGPTPARLVCGPRERDIAALGPYLTRTLTTQAPPVMDMTAELRIKPLDERFGKDLRMFLPQAPSFAKREFGIGEPRFDGALEDAAKGLADELGLFLKDVDSLGVKVGLTRDGMTMTGTLSMTGKSSWLGGTMADTATRAGPAPELFWRLPKDADYAFFSQGADPGRYAGMMKVLQDLAEGGLASVKIGSAADQKAIASLLRAPLKKGTVTVQASGTNPQKPGAGKPNTQTQIDSILSGWMGWNLIGMSEGPDEVGKWVKDAVAAYNRPGIQAYLRKELGSDANMLPIVKQKPAPAGMGAGSFAVEMTIPNLESPDFSDPGGAKPKKISITFHLLVMADGDSTWIALGGNRDELVKRLQSVRGSAPKTEQLLGRVGLDDLKSGKRVSGGFFTVGMVTNSIGSSLSSVMSSPLGGAAPPEVKGFLEALNNLPNKGKTPIMLTNSVTVREGVRNDLTLSLSSGSVQDINAIVAAAMRLDL